MNRQIFQHAQIDKPSADEFNSNVTKPILMLNVFKYCLIVVGIVLFLVAVALIVRRYYKVCFSNYPLQ